MRPIAILWISFVLLCVALFGTHADFSGRDWSRIKSSRRSWTLILNSFDLAVVVFHRTWLFSHFMVDEIHIHTLQKVQRRPLNLFFKDSLLFFILLFSLFDNFLDLFFNFFFNSFFIMEFLTSHKYFLQPCSWMNIFMSF